MQGHWTLLHVIGLVDWQKHVKSFSLSVLGYSFQSQMLFSYVFITEPKHFKNLHGFSKIVMERCEVEYQLALSGYES